MAKKLKVGDKVMLNGFPCDTRNPDMDVEFIKHFGITQTVKKVVPQSYLDEVSSYGWKNKKCI